MNLNWIGAAVITAVVMTAAPSEAQTPIPLMQPPGAAGAPIVVTLPDAINRAKKVDAIYLGSVADASLAAEDRVQVRASMLPSVNSTVQDLVTQGNGVLPSGRFITNDGVHVYRAVGVLHQDLSADTVLKTGLKHAQAAESVAKAKVDVARYGLESAVTKNYYALVTSQRKYVTAQLLVQQAERFLQFSRQQERLGQVARADTVKGELQYQQLRQAFDDVTLAMEIARLNLAVMLFPTLNENFSVVDDLDSTRPLPPFSEVQSMAEKQNPDLRVAMLTTTQLGFEVKSAKNALLPALTIDADYGIEANAFKLHSTVAASPEFGPLPNLGFFITGTLNVPIWNWGSLRSKVNQAQIRQRQAEVQLDQAHRQLVGSLYAAYNEALAALNAVTAMRNAADLATESLRLTNLRYQAGESSALEVVDAQNALSTARNAYDDAQVRHRLAISTLQTLTGGF